MADILNPAFFDAVRPLFGGSLSQPQVDGLKTIIGAWLVIGDGDDRKLAYILATTKHETGNTMQPVRETFATSDQQAKDRLERAWNLKQLSWVKTPYWRDGWFGRGYVQLTHKENYAKASKKLGVDLVADPSLALQPGIAAHILIRGCLEGWFTGKSLADYINASGTDYLNARRVVNGTDRAQLIAGYAKDFERAIASGTSNAVVPEPEQPEPAEHGWPDDILVTPSDPKPSRPGWLAIAIIVAIGLAGIVFAIVTSLPR